MINRIARALTLAPRWAGNLTREFYVSDHLLVGQAWLQRNGASAGTQRAWLLHDAFEAWTADVPTPFKTPDFKAQENEGLAKLANEWGVDTKLLFGDEVKQCDFEMAAAEDQVVHFTPCGQYGRAPDMLVFMVENRPQQTWAERQSEFIRVWNEHFERVEA